MKTDILEIKHLKNMIRTKKGKIKCWVCGKDYWADLYDVANEDEMGMNYWGQRYLLGIGVAVVEDHPKLNNNEIVLLNEVEFEYAVREQKKWQQ